MAAFDTDDETRLLCRSLDDFVSRTVEPLESTHRDLLVPDFRRLDEDGRIRPEVLDLMDEVRRESGQAGFYGANMPESVGGGGLSTTQLVRLIQRLYAHGFGLNVFAIESAPGPSPVLVDLPEHLVERYVEPTVRGEQTMCFALTESDSGSDALDMDTTAKRDGDEWVVDGRKQWITNAPYADYGQVFAITDPDADGARRVSSFLFDTDADGFEIERVNGTVLNDGMQATVSFDGMRVPDDHMVGGRGEGFYEAMSFVNTGRVRIGARCAGLMAFLRERTVEYATERESWGQPIGTRQHVRRLVAEIATWQETTENLVLRTAHRIDRGEDPIQQSAMVKYYATEKLFEAADNAVQVFGANGLSHEYPIQRIFRYARLMRIPEGTSEIQLETIADQEGLP